MTKLHVSVTQAHIDAGVSKSECRCPIALALTDAGCTGVEVGNFTVGFKYGTQHVDVDIPQLVERFVRDFDFGRQVFPFEFDLEF